MGGIVFASGEQPWNWPLPSEPIALRIVELQPESFGEQAQAWRAVTNGAFTDAELHLLASLQPLPVATIPDVWRMAQVLGATTVDADASPSIEHVRQACRAHAGRPASTLARRIEPTHTWNDLVLPGPQLEQLTALCGQAKHSSIVYGSWGFERKLALGRGLNALFCGPPGTGKSMAAEVIASDLGLEILKIDLSQIVSKYIGETEKNLRQLFDQAGRANAILFFDEADALLGKRSEVKDAHDRYANTETAYLLQKMEEYTGISILATNFRQNIDEAFVRRMRFIVDFPFPEEDDRLRIWQSVWPSEVPFAADVDLPTLARQFRLAGGSIRNVALCAAFLAAEQGRPVSMRHLMRATKRELQKMGRLVNEEEHRKYG
jgi:MoxR-like ATPase